MRVTMHVARQLSPHLEELKHFFEEAFTEIEDTARFTPENSQDLAEWFSVEAMIAYLPEGSLIEARTADGTLVGAVFIGKQNPLSWPDGRKMEIFILAVDRNLRKQGVARQLMAKAEEYAKAEGARSIIVNTHVVMETVHAFYEKLGYVRMGVLEGYYENGDAVFFGKRVYYLPI